LPERNSSAPSRAVFLDRDGTILDEVGYLNHISRFHLYPFAAAAIRRLNDVGLPVVVVTNQSGVARGFFPESLVHETHEKLRAALAREGAHVDAFYFCPHLAADNCTCRKPLPGMLERAAREHNLSLTGSFVVGDRYADMELAHAAGCRSILVLTGYGTGDHYYHQETWPRQPDHVTQNLEMAVDIILKELA
jgi:D-glycero-D-manno-heptose 1,7-bisphosphate phosphatase